MSREHNIMKCQGSKNFRIYLTHGILRAAQRLRAGLDLPNIGVQLLTETSLLQTLTETTSQHVQNSAFDFPTRLLLLHCFLSQWMAPPCIQWQKQDTSTTLDQALIISCQNHCSDILIGLLCTVSHTPHRKFLQKAELNTYHIPQLISFSGFQCSWIKTKL